MSNFVLFYSEINKMQSYLVILKNKLKRRFKWLIEIKKMSMRSELPTRFGIFLFKGKKGIPIWQSELEKIKILLCSFVSFLLLLNFNLCTAC